MTQAPYMQLYVGDYLADTLDLTTEQHGAYLLLLMTMWRHGARLPNDDKKLARVARLSARRWHLIWPHIERFFEVDGDDIINRRLVEEYQKVVSLSQKRSASGSLGGKAKALKDNDVSVASAGRLPKHSQKSEPYTEEEVSSSVDVRADLLGQVETQDQPPSRSKPRKRIPDGWAPSDEDVLFAKSEGLDHDEISREAGRFRDHWQGTGEPKRDWSATWRNWCRRVADRGRGGNRQGVQPRPAQSGHDTFRAAMAAEVARRSGGQLQPAGDRGGHRTIEGTAERVGEPEW